LAGAAGGGLVAGCDGEGLPVDLVSEEQLRRLGLQAWEQTLKQHRPTRDRALQREVESQAGVLLRAAGEDPAAWEVTVFAADEANAFVVPGRKMGIYEGMVATTEDRAQLAAVIGHEIGHHRADHAEERLETALVTRTGLQIAETVLEAGDVAFADEIAGVMGLGAEYGILLPYSRAHELEADRLGMEIMAKAGVDPAAAIALWQRMGELAASRPPAFLSTHPSPGRRIEALRAHLDAARAVAG
jgi:predicted Zn-dependent protease